MGLGLGLGLAIGLGLGLGSVMPGRGLHHSALHSLATSASSSQLAAAGAGALSARYETYGRPSTAAIWSGEMPSSLARRALRFASTASTWLGVRVTGRG